MATPGSPARTASASQGDSTPAPGDPSTDQTVVVQTVRLPIEPTRPIGDLAQEKLIRDASRVRVGGIIVPSLGGIPLLCKLGQGGMGAVYYGIQPSSGQEVAVKVLPFHLADRNPLMLQRFHREARLAASIESPHLVRILNVSEENGLVFMVMEYVSGSSAGAYIKALRAEGLVLKERPALDLCLAAAHGLAAAHAQGVIHRDIKPDNILIPWDSANNRPMLSAAKVADLGLARNVEMHGESLTASSAALGTPGYMAPEQGLDAKTAGRPADIFSLGATLYAVLCGRAPFRATSVMLTLLDTAQRPHIAVRDIRQDISDGTAALIDRCLAKDPARRFADAGALIAALEQCRAALTESTELTLKLDLPDIPPASSTQPVHGGEYLFGRSPVPSAPPPLVPVKRSKAWWIALLAGAAAFLLLGVLAFRPEEKPEPKPIRVATERPPSAAAAPRPASDAPAPAPPPQAPAPAPSADDRKQMELAEAAAQLGAQRSLEQFDKALKTETVLAEKSKPDLALGMGGGATDGRTRGTDAERLEAGSKPAGTKAAAPPPPPRGVSIEQMTYDKALAAGREALVKKDWATANKVFQHALALRPDDEDAKKGLQVAAMGMRRDEQFRAAVVAAEEAMRAGNFGAAEKQFQKASVIQPDSPEVQAAMERLREENRRKQESKITEREGL